MTPRRALVFLLGVAGLGLYLWPALAAPVVFWSDSELDLRWAQQQPWMAGAVAGETHPAKPGYLVFLRLAMLPGGPGSPTRSIVIVQSLLVWAAFAATSILVARRQGAPAGILLYCALLAFVRFRDSTSAILSEPLTIAIALALTALLLNRDADSPVRCLGLGLGVGLLFLVRPNVGLPIGAAAVLVRARKSEARNALRILAGVFCIVGPILLFLRPSGPRDPLGGIGAPILLGSAPYYWPPSLGSSLPESSSQRLHEAFQRWRRFLGGRGPDARRETAWRALHGLLGTEFYDPRWSSLYERIDIAGRLGGPFLTMLALGVVLAGGSVPPDRLPTWVASVFVLMLVAHNLVFGSHPRYLLPFLPVLFLLAVERFPAMRLGKEKRWLAAVLIFAVLVACTRAFPGVADWEAGIVEAAGVEIVQRIPAGALPGRSPATLHVRIASPVLPTEARLTVFEPSTGTLYDGTEDRNRSTPLISMSLPQALLSRSSRQAIELHVRSSGAFDRFHYLLFPVVPPPWGDRARRIGSAELSPRTGILRGGLDWWAHAGAE